MEVRKLDHDNRDRGPAEPLDRFEPVSLGDKLACSRHDKRLEQAGLADDVNKVSGLCVGDRLAKLTHIDEGDRDFVQVCSSRHSVKYVGRVTV